MEPSAIISLLVAVIVAGASLASPRRSVIYLAWWNLFSCVICNGLQLKFPAVMGLDPLALLDAVGLASALILTTGDPPRRWLWVVAAAFLVQLVGHGVYALGLVSTLNYRRVLNVFFFVQEAAILLAIFSATAQGKGPGLAPEAPPRRRSARL